MREIVFLKRNAEKWKKIETYVGGGSEIDPDSLAGFFVELTDDLSYSRTFYPQTNTTMYLNGLTAKVHQAIYRNKREKRNRLFRFFKYEYPRVIAASGREMITSFTIFALAVLVGLLSTLYDDSFVRLILGDSYVNLTLENIENNDPMAIYKKMHEIDMFLGITFNNIKVAFFAFAGGILFSFGTGLLLFYNGVMLGTFEAFFYQNGLLFESVKSIWIHGTLEISAIIVAGAAGLALGNSLLFPKTYSRGDSFKMGARRGMKIVVGMVPIFIVAGFLEGFVTRHSDMPTYVSLSIIVGSLIFIVFYLIIYPKLINPEEDHVHS